MRSKLTRVLLAAMLALGGGTALAACNEDDRPEGEDIERGVEDAGDAAKDAAEDAGDAAKDAGEAAEDAGDDARDDGNDDGR